MITVYYHPLSPYARKVKISLDYKGIDHQTIEEGLFEPGGPAEKLRCCSPRAEIPVLEDGEVKIWDSTVICEYLEDAYPERPILPEEASARARCRLLEDRCDTTFDAAMHALYAGKVIAKESPLAERLVQAAAGEVRALMREFEGEIAAAGFLCGKRLTVADIALFTHVSGAVGLGIPLEGVDKLQNWLAGMMALPCVQKDMAAAQAAMAKLDGGMTAGVATSGAVTAWSSSSAMAWWSSCLRRSSGDVSTSPPLRATESETLGCKQRIACLPPAAGRLCSRPRSLFAQIQLWRNLTPIA